MQSASPSGGFALLLDLPGAAWQRTRQALPAPTLWAALITFLLVYVIARSTVAASWVSGIEIAPSIALAGAALMGILAVTPLPWWGCVSVGLALGPVVAGIITAPVFRSQHALDPSGLPLIQTWLSRVGDGTAFADSAFTLFVIVWLMWVTGAWLTWCVLKWRQPLVGLIPGAAAFATNVLNFPADQNSYTLEFLVLTFALLLWTNYTSSVAKAVSARVKLTGDARWDFWESGLVATAALIVLAILLPPLSTVDRTVSMQSSLFSDWAQLQQDLNHPATAGNGTGTGTTGFSTTVSLGGPLKKSKTVVFTYTFAGNYPGPHYFRGVNVVATEDGKWMYEPAGALSQRIPKSTQPSFADTYLDRALGTFSINMIVPPGGNTDLLFYPGQLYRIDRETVATELDAPPKFSSSPFFVTIDRLSSRVPPHSTGAYNITVEYPDVLESDLRQAGKAYPPWLQPYTTVRPQGYRPPDVLQRIHDLAVEIVTAAKATNPYDEAMAIQTYLRGSTFHYTLNPRSAPPGTDQLEYFLFNSHEGYCQYFAIAMGDMLRALGIPVRLVNGYGPGSFDTTHKDWVVRDEDAHTWVEAYFPSYGWLPFEPTNDNTYFPIQRGSQGTNVCLVDNNCGDTIGTTGPGGGTTQQNPGRTGGNQDPGGIPIGSTGFTLRALDANTLTRIIAVLLALLLLAGALGARYLRPRTVMGVWKRTLVLARLAGAAVQPGETPLELSRRLARIYPEAAEPVRALAGGFVVAAYAPPELAESTRTSVMEAWTTLRPLMLKRVAGRLRPGRA